jgi:hypothetical protein
VRISFERESYFSRERKKRNDFRIVFSRRHDFSFFFLATASDSDSDAEDGSNINIREIQHVSVNDAFYFYIIMSFLIEKCIWFH